MNAVLENTQRLLAEYRRQRADDEREREASARAYHGNHADLPDILMNHLPAAALDYGGWLAVGMALHNSGLPCDVWEDWSSRDADRYHPGECQRKWRGFKKGRGVGSGTIVALAEKYGTYERKVIAYV